MQSSKHKKTNNPQLPVVIVLLLVVTIAAYLPVLRADFVNFDDEQYVTDNPTVQSGLTAEGVKWAFNSGYAYNWHPVTWISHMVDRQVFGAGPAGPHAVNLLLHLANTLLLFFIFNRMTKSLWKSALVAALFAVHPMHVESVAWIAERKDVLSTLFWMLTMWAYVRYSEAPNVKRYAVIIVSLALGLMSKPTLVTLPIVLLLMDYWPLDRWSGGLWRLLKEKLPLFAMSAASCVITYLAQQRGDAVQTFAETPLASRIGNALIAYVSYIAKMIWPSKLAVYYPYPASISTGHVLGAIAILVLVTALVMRMARSRPYLIVGWLWYLAVLVPMIGLVQVGGQAMADRYTYVPFIGLFIMLTWGISDLLSHRVSVSPRPPVPASTRSRASQPPCPPVSIFPRLGIVPVLVVIILAACTWRQAGYWRDSVTLWTHTIAVTTNNDVAHNNLGMAYGRLGMPAEEVEEYQKAVQVNPGFEMAYVNLGASYISLQRYGEAVDAFQQATRVDPDHAKARFGLGLAHLLTGSRNLALKEYKALMNLDPDMATRLLAFINKRP